MKLFRKGYYILILGILFQYIESMKIFIHFWKTLRLYDNENHAIIHFQHGRYKRTNITYGGAFYGESNSLDIGLSENLKIDQITAAASVLFSLECLIYLAGLGSPRAW